MACAGMSRNSEIAASAAAWGLPSAFDKVAGDNPEERPISAKVTP